MLGGPNFLKDRRWELDFNCPSHNRVFYINFILCVFVGGAEVEIPIVMLGAGEGSVKIAPSGISCKYSV